MVRNQSAIFETIHSVGEIKDYALDPVCTFLVVVFLHVFIQALCLHDNTLQHGK